MRARLEAITLVLVAIHSYVVGVMLLFSPGMTLRMGGWDPSIPLFFVRQGGVFHWVLATIYLIDFFQRRSITTLLVAKSTATLFLISMIGLGNDSWVVWVSMLGDGAMFGVMALLHRQPR